MIIALQKTISILQESKTNSAVQESERMTSMRLIDADRLSEAIYDNVPAPYEDASWAKENCLAEIEAA